MHYLFSELKSGLQLIRVPMEGVPSVTTMTLVNTGSRYEKPNVEGIAHFFEHMVFKGSEDYPDAKAIASTIDAIGAKYNAFTSKEYTGYYVKAAGEHIEKSLDVVSDMLIRPKLKQEDIDRERSVIIEEINMYQDHPMRYASYLFDELFFRGSGLEHDVLGSKTTVESINRDNFITFLRQWYGLGNTTVILAGNKEAVKSRATLNTIKDVFSKEPEQIRPRDKVKIDKLLSKESPVSPHKLRVMEKATEQAHLVLGWPGIERASEQRYALALLNVIMGGNMSSRLFSEVREKRGLCYYVRSENDYYHDAGVFGASAGVDPQRINEAIKVIKSEFVAVGDGEQAVTEEELDQAKEYLTGSMTIGFEDSKNVAQFFGLKQTLTDDIEDPEKTLDKLRDVELEEVTEIAEQLLDSREMRLAVIGPYEDEDRFKQFVSEE